MRGAMRVWSSLIIVAISIAGFTTGSEAKSVFSCQFENDPEGKYFREYDVDDGSWEKSGVMYISKSQKPFTQIEFQSDGQHYALADGKGRVSWPGHCFRVDR